MHVDLDVLLPFHREDAYLGEAISSLASSKGLNLNIIIIDDRINKSKNLSSLFSLLPKFQLLKTSGGVGYGEAIKLGSTLIEADAVALFNSDDLVHPKRFVHQLKELDRSSLNFTKMQRIGPRGENKRSISGDIKGESYDPLLLLLGSYGANASWCMRTEWWKINSFFDSGECLDWRIAMKSFPNSSISFIPEALYYYRKHDGQKTNNFSVSRESMNCVYLEWLALSKTLGFEVYSYEIFSGIGLPWISGYRLNTAEFSRAAKSISDYARKFDAPLKKSVNYLLKRRFVFAIRNADTLSEKINFMKNGAFQNLEISFDFLLEKF
jgi:glycosyltransferase involved in cell wall biosynthesis